jgi:hypothetical protein
MVSHDLPRCQPVGDERALAGTIEGLVADPQRARRLTTAAPQTAERYVSG